MNNIIKCVFKIKKHVRVKIAYKVSQFLRKKKVEEFRSESSFQRHNYRNTLIESETDRSLVSIDFKSARGSLGPLLKRKKKYILTYMLTRFYTHPVSILTI